MNYRAFSNDVLIDTLLSARSTSTPVVMKLFRPIHKYKLLIMFQNDRTMKELWISQLNKVINICLIWGIWLIETHVI